MKRMLKALGFVLIPESWGRVNRILRMPFFDASCNESRRTSLAKRAWKADQL